MSSGWIGIPLDRFRGCEHFPPSLVRFELNRPFSEHLAPLRGADVNGTAADDYGANVLFYEVCSDLTDAYGRR